ncbi:hypothetical protein [Brevibacterium sp. JSBI002]|uniref:hypothetical protein n=1 Tax=Brevibacterium sp. JSBI002 TaxID=2886045 RepID=UPI0022304BAD|nr:hypothetical protein [Brevibacterium sp. JSBI002]UZD61091.1 hypothetical protein LJ362_10315 [Brevibacterium sp. JSBI002]
MRPAEQAVHGGHRFAGLARLADARPAVRFRRGGAQSGCSSTSHGPRPRRPSSTGVVCTTNVTGILLCIRVKFVGMLQPAVVLEPFGLHSFFALRGLSIQLFSLGRLTISLGSSSIGLSLCALCICPLFLDFGLSSTNIMFGFSSFLSNLGGFLSLVFALLRRRFSADCDDDPDDDQDHDDGDDDPDDG